MSVFYCKEISYSVGVDNNNYNNNNKKKHYVIAYLSNNELIFFYIFMTVWRKFFSYVFFINCL